jgi:hypothetical protein
MGARAALVLLSLAAVGVVQLVLFASPSTPRLYAVGFAPTSISPPRHMSPYMMTNPRLTTIHKIEVDAATKSEVMKLLDSTDLEDVQRSVLLSLFRVSQKQVSGMDGLLDNPSGEAAIVEAAHQVFFIARDMFGGPVKDFVDTCLKGVMLTTKDAQERVGILDECFRAFPSDYEDTPIEDSLRLFRMLLLPDTADIANAKTTVRTYTARLNRDTAESVEKWMRKMEAGKPGLLGPSDFAEDCLQTTAWDPMDLWMPLMPRKKQTPATSATDCFRFEESLRNYKILTMDLLRFDI